MALQDVKNDILKEAKEEKREIEKEAEEKADEIIKEAEEKAEMIREKSEEELEKEKEAKKRKKISNAKMQARQKKLEAKQDKIQEVFNRVKEAIENLGSKERKRLVINAIDEAEFNVGKIRASSDFKDAVDQRKLEFEEADINGFILISENKERSKNFSIGKIVEDIKDENRKEVAERLFEEVNE